MTLAAIAVLAVFQQSDAAIEGRELLHKLIKRAETAKTIRLATQSDLTGHPQGPRRAEFTLVLRGRDEFRATLLQDAHLMRLKSDGKAILHSGRSQVDPKTLDPANIVDWLRHRAAVASFVALDFLDPSTLSAGMPPIDKAVLEGEEKVGTGNAKIVSYSFPVGAGVKTVAVRAWIDPERLVVLKREAKLGPMILRETIEVMEYDAEVNGDDFAIQSKTELRRAQVRMVADSVALYGRWMGRRAARLADLDVDPGGGGFWPEGGFWIGGPRPPDAPVGEAAVGSSRLSAPTERLAKLFTAQLRLRLLKSAVEAYEATYWRLPTKGEDLVRKPDGFTVWPEGGFVRDAALLKDPWGEPFEFVPRRQALVVRCARFNERRVLDADLERDERVKLIASTVDPLPADKLAALPVAKLGDPDPGVRDAAAREILSLGPAVIGAVDAQLAKEDVAADIRAGLQSIRDRLASMTYAWRGLLGGPRVVAYGESPGRPSTNEKIVKTNLAEFVRAQGDFHKGDPDHDHVANYWVADVAGLYATGRDKVQEVPGVFFSRADATPGRKDYPALEGFAEPEPFVGAYLTASLAHYEDSAGKRVRYDDGKGRNPDRFGFIMFPDQYGQSGILTFIVDHTGAKWSKDLGGGEIDTFPRDPAAAGWEAVQ